MFLIIDAVTCLKQDDYTGKDDIFLLVNNGFPRTIEVGELVNHQTKKISREVTLTENSQHSIEIWERDELSANDLIGTIFLADFTPNMEQQAVVENGDVSYKLWFTIVTESQ
ncbi:hypothetical protein KJS94_09640 [Flavihumibacter rivuli]|uniref:hypothetical protein n=1 Tax=Flavihumibacter rivuli TaxID=2838156 RepID=UPI001BDE15E8|nr:hypothetical protein [Flavihumibacter rivuli]ULQ54899.1 hypothetical protein KJS94_09640 [Flavihumibacter rivuli]